MGFPDSSIGKESACNAGDPSSIPGLGRPPGEGIGYPLQYSWASLVAQLVKNLPAMRRPGFNPWVGKVPWRRERLPNPVFSPAEFHGLYSPWSCKESDLTGWLEKKKNTDLWEISRFIHCLFAYVKKKSYLKLKCCVFFKAQEHNSKWLLFFQELNSIWTEKKKSDIDNK